jgi:multidrug efflux system outer membrane protein
MKIPIPALLAALISSGCTLGPDFVDADLSGSGDWKQRRAVAGARLPDDWWRLFNDRDLDRLVARALAANQDLAAAASRVATARALVGVDRAGMFPRLDLSGSAGISRASQDATYERLPSGLGIDIPLETENYRGVFDLAYEPDLWGRKRRQVEASSAEAAAAEALFDAQRLGIAAETARQYFLIRGLDVQESVIRETIRSRADTLDLLQSKADAGLTDGLATSQARTELELARNDLALVERQRGAAENALAVLCGERPAAVSVAPRLTSPAMPAIRAGLPAEVLNRRPDVRAAAQTLRAANARIGVAEAAFYPSFSLFGGAGYESVDAARFLDWQNRVLSLGAGVAAPVMDAGANRARFQAAVSARDEALAAYRNRLLTALREVEDALVDLKGLDRSRRTLERALASARDTARISRERYDKGLSSFLEVVEADRTVLRVRLVLAQTDAQQRINLAVLAKALGGGWSGK